METIQIVLDRELLHATDRAARRAKQSRSALVRDALRQHLHRMDVRALQEQDRRGYSKKPKTGELVSWELEASWP